MKNKIYNKDELTDYIGSVNDERLWKHINAALKKTFGLWIYNTDRNGDVHCLCPKCLSDYIHDPNYVVRRLDPFAKSKDHCDKCNNSGWDYIVYDRRTSVKGKTLDELRYKEEQIEKDKKDGIKAEARYTTLNDIYELWKDLKRGLKNNTFENYKYMYETFVRQQIGSKTVSSLKKSDIKRFYNYLADERHLKPATIDNIHTVLHQILDMAVDDDYLRNNPSNNVLKELKQSHCFQTEKRRALTRPEQELLLSYLKNTPSASLWYPIFAVLIGTGLRVGEATGLRWCDIDLEEGIIDVNHTLVYYDHRTEGSKRGCYFNINTTKTPAGKQLFASKYKLYLPTEEELKAEIETQKAMFYLQQKESEEQELE